MCGIADFDDSALVPAVQRDPLNRRAAHSADGQPSGRRAQPIGADYEVVASGAAVTEVHHHFV
jgi:hypothetical protein